MMYTEIMQAMAASGAVAISKLTNGMSMSSNHSPTRGPTSTPPSTTPRMIEPMVKPSIQPLALTSCDGGNSSVKMPYFAGE